MQATYYIPFKSIKKNGKVIRKLNARGKLYNKYVNILRCLSDEGVYCENEETNKENDLPELS